MSTDMRLALGWVLILVAIGISPMASSTVRWAATRLIQRPGPAGRRTVDGRTLDIYRYTVISQVAKGQPLDSIEGLHEMAAWEREIAKTPTHR